MPRGAARVEQANVQAAPLSGRAGLLSVLPRRYFFERDEELRLREPVDLRERDAVLDLRAVVPLRAVLPAALRVRVLAPVLRVLRAGLALRELAALFFAAVFVAERLVAPFLVSPAVRRCLFTTRAASSSARSTLSP